MGGARAGTGVATLPAFRRRGVAAAISSRLISDRFAGGAPAVWLSAGDAAAASLYEKIGFQHAGRQLNDMDRSSEATLIDPLSSDGRNPRAVSSPRL